MQALQVGALAGAELVLQHVDVAADALAQRAVAAWVGEASPECASGVTAGRLIAPQRCDRVGRLGLREALQRERVAQLELALQRIAAGAAVRAFVDRRAMHLVVVA